MNLLKSNFTKIETNNNIIEFLKKIINISKKTLDFSKVLLYNVPVTFAGMMELADVLDSKSSGSDTVRVRPPLPAPKIPNAKAFGILLFHYSHFTLH